MNETELISQYINYHKHNPKKIVFGRQKYLEAVQEMNNLGINVFENNNRILVYRGIPLEKNFNIEGMYVE
jgi:hypothetical protein